MRRPLLATALVLLSQQADAARLDRGMPLPQLSRPALDGKPIDLHALRGRVVLIDFWASWCAPCLVAMPHLIALQRNYGQRGLQVVGISMDDSAAAAKAVAAQFAFNYPLILGDAKLGAQFGGILGLPVEMLAGRDGKILKIWTGEVSPAELERAIRAATR